VIRTLDVSDPRWVAFISSMLEANIFHHPAWINNLAQCYGHNPFIIADVDDHGFIQAGLPMIEFNSLLTGRRWVSLPFSDYCVPLFCDVEALRKLTEYLVDVVKIAGLPRIELRWQYPYHPAVYSTSRYVFHTAQLENDIEHVFSRIHPKVRKYIRSSERRGVHIKQGTNKEYVRYFYYQQMLTRHKHGIPPQPWKYFELLGKNVLEKGLGSILLAFFEEKCIGGMVILHFQNTLTLKYGASDEKYVKELRPNHLLEWTAIQWGCEHGYKVLDVGRSDNDQKGLREYKDKWGYIEAPLIYSIISSQPPSKRIYPFIHFSQQIVKISPLWFSKILGEVFYKFLS